MTPQAKVAQVRSVMGARRDSWTNNTFIGSTSTTAIDMNVSLQTWQISGELVLAAETLFNKIIAEAYIASQEKKIFLSMIVLERCRFQA
jgi:hypothetical protein